MTHTNYTITNAGFGGIVEMPRLRVLKGAVRPAKGQSTVNLC